MIQVNILIIITIHPHSSLAMCAACAPAAGCTTSSTGIITCTCPAGFSGTLCDTRNYCHHTLQRIGTWMMNSFSFGSLCSIQSKLFE